jgi:hypothetical protein
MKWKMNWGWRIAIVYSLFALSTVGFVVFAMSENVELVRKDYYEESLRYDASFASQLRGNAIAEGVAMRVDAEGIQLALPIAHGTADSAVVQFYRAENSKLDRRFSITGTSIHIPASELVKGNYQAEVAWRFDGQWYKITRSVTVGS